MTDHDALFADRCEAGRLLAAALQHLTDASPVVLALPRGGVPVASEVAAALEAPLDVVLVRKIGAPGQPELGIGAVVDGRPPRTVWNQAVLREFHVSDVYRELAERRELAEIERRRRLYRGGRPAAAVRGRTAIVVDDGVATGSTVRAALAALREAGPRRLVLAVPVAPADTLAELAGEADEIVCLASPEPFLAVGQHYRDFTQTSDAEVIALLRRAGRADAERRPDAGENT